jgi:hypothetical protein
MRTPGFTAEHALPVRSGADRAAPRAVGGMADGSPPADRVLPQNLHWGDTSYDGCSISFNGFLRFSAILWGIPWGQSWEATCRTTPGAPANIWPPRVPHHCENTGFNIWGVWYEFYPSC